MSIDFDRFMTIAREEKAYDVLEAWDKASFDAWVKEIGPMTLCDAYSLCCKAISEEEEAASEYFSKR